MRRPGLGGALVRSLPRHAGRDLTRDTMRGSEIALLLVAAALFASSAKAPARADDISALTCDVHGRFFILDDTDFAALAAAGVSRERFLSLALDSRDRRAVCDTRMLSRLIKSGAADACDFDRYDVVTRYFDKSELRAALDTITKRHDGKCR
jgi:hypothetical protein